jgi:hypothetical protein
MTTHLSRAVVAHALPGRTRIRISDRKHDREFFQRAAATLIEMDGTGPVTINPVSASVLVLHRDSVEALGAFAREHGLFDLAPQVIEAPPPRRPLPQAVGDKLQLADFALRYKTGNKTDLATITFGALIIGAGVQLLRGQFLPASATLLHYALDLVPRRTG